jgi:hypothetical protein
MIFKALGWKTESDNCQGKKAKIREIRMEWRLSGLTGQMPYLI